VLDLERIEMKIFESLWSRVIDAITCEIAIALAQASNLHADRHSITAAPERFKIFISITFKINT